jgi:hypothetical protein
MLGALFFATRSRKRARGVVKDSRTVGHRVLMMVMGGALALLAFIGSCGRHW